MAKRIHEEDIKLNIIVGNNQAQKKIYDLEAANRKLREEQSKLYEVKNKLEAQGKKESAEYKNTTSRLKELRLEISANKNEIKQLSDTLGVTGMTMQQLRQRAAILRATLNNMVPGSAKYKELQGELREVTARMQQLNGAARAQSLTWSSAANWLNKYQTMIIGFAAAVTGVTITLQKWIDYGGKLSDQQADVMKTTGMTADEVDELTESFGRLETRTSRINLLKIAEEGGRIGIAKDEMTEFVEVMDKASVALGDSFTGGVEEVSSVLGKLKFLFEETKNLGVDQAYNAIGSAINDLGADGVATEKNIAEFATRLGSLPNQLKPTVAEALALGAAFEESGIQAEVSARAYSIFLNRAATNTAEFAKVLGVTTEEAKAMIDADPVEFFLKFGEALKRSNVSATQMSKMLQDMGINADGANKIIGAISNNTQRFRDQINLSNKSMAEASSLTTEFNTKNNTLAGTLDKINKTLAAWFSSETLMEWLKGAVEWFARLIGATEDADGSGKKWREGLILAAKILAILVTGIGSYNAGMKLYTLWTTRATAGSLLWSIQMRIQNALAAISVIRTGLMTAANALFTQGIKAAVAQIRIMNAVLGVSPWGAVAAAIGLVVSALVLFRNETDKAITKQRLLNSLNAEAEKSIAGQRKEIELLLKVARDENLEKEKRISALNRLNEIIPGYNDLLNLEKINTLEASAAVKKYTDELYRNARAKALQAKFDDLERQKIDAEQKSAGDYRGSLSRATSNVSDRIFSAFGVEKMEFKSVADVEKYVRANYKELNEQEIRGVINTYLANTGLLEKQNQLDAITNQQKIIEAEMLKMLQEDPGAMSDGLGDTGGEYTAGDAPAAKKGGGESAADKAKREREKRIQELISENEKLSQELLAIQRANEDAQLDIMEEGFQKEQAQLQTEHGRRIADLKKQIVDENTINELRKERGKASASGDTERVGLIDGMIAQIEQKNAELEQSILQANITYEHKRGIIHTKYANKRLDERIKEIEDEKKARENAYLQEVISLGSTEAIKERLKGSMSKKELDQIKTWEDAKKALKAQYDQEELDAEIKQTKQLFDEMNAALASGNFTGFDVSLMSEEGKEKFLQDIEELKAKLIELGIAKADLQNGTGESTGSLGEVSIAGNTDILGMSPEAWETFIENIDRGKFELEELTAVVGMLQSAFATYYAYVQAQEQRNMALFDQNTNRKRTALKRQLDSGMISQEQYDKKLQKLEEEAEKRKAIMEYEGAMRAWRMNLANAVVSAAMATLSGFNSTPFLPVGLAMGALAATLGTIQVATVMKNKPVKGFEEGYYPDELFDVVREQDGKSFRASYGGRSRSGLVNSPTMFLAGEGGQYMPEMIISGNDWKNFHPDLRNDIIRSVAGMKGYENGYYPNVDNVGMTESNAEMKATLDQLTVLMAQNAAVMQRLMEHTPQAFIVPDFEQMRTWKKTEEDYTIHQNKNRV